MFQYIINRYTNVCFRSDGLPTEAIVLPTDKPFYLFQYKRDVCQKVANMHVRQYLYSLHKVNLSIFLYFQKYILTTMFRKKKFYTIADGEF